MARARKLFPIYGSALANAMLATLTRDRVVSRFVAAYVDKYGRPGILGGPARDKELAETVGREILLAMIVEARQALPAFFGKKTKSKLKSEEREAIDAFSNELMAALARAQNLSEEDLRQFQNDLARYSEFSAREKAASGARKRGKPLGDEAPFIARVALLLDPSVLEQSRLAAEQLHIAVGLTARKLLRNTLGSGGS